MSLEFTKNRLENSDSRIEKYIDENIIDWSEQEFLLPTQDAIIQLGLSQDVANAVSIVKTGFMKTKLRWDFEGPDGEPLWNWLENGWGKGGYDIEALGKVNGHADYLKYVGANGKRIFRKKVRHPGFEGYQVIQKTYDRVKDQFTRRVTEETNNFLEVEKL